MKFLFRFLQNDGRKKMKKLGKKFKTACFAALAIAALLATSQSRGLITHAVAGPAPSATQPATQPASHAKTKLDDAAVLAFLKQYEPEVYDGALVLQSKDAPKFAEMLKMINADVCTLLDIQKRNLPLFDVTVRDRRLGYQAFQLAKELRDTVLTAEVRQARTAQLHDVVSLQFANRQKKREMELAELQTKLDDLKRELDDRQLHESELINHRIDDLLNKTPKIEW